MKTKAKAIPEGWHSITAYISVKGAGEAIEFYKSAFGAIETGRLTMPDGSIGHAELEIGDSKIMLAEENEQWGNRSPQTIGGTPVSLCLYVDDVDAVFAKALQSGAKVTGEMVVKDQFYGDRTGGITDPFGHQWSIMTHIEDVSFEEMQKRMSAMFQTN